MTNEEKQEIINAVLSAIMTNSKTIEQLTPTESLSDNDAIEVSGGRRISYAAFLSAVQVGVQLMLDGYLTGESAVAWFAALENNPANYVGASADPVQLHWRQSPIVLLDSMGEDLDGDDDFTAQVGDKWWDPSNDNSRNYIFLKTSTGQEGWPIGSGNVNDVLYVNKRTGRMYLWNGTDMVELVGATGGGGSTVTITKGGGYVDIDIIDNTPVIEVSTQSIVMSGQTKTATFTVSGHNLTAPIRINGGNAYFSKSPSSISPVGGIVEATTVTVTFGGSADDTDDLIVSSVGAASKAVHVAYTAVAGPNIVVSPASLSFCAATNQTQTKQVAVQGSLLTDDVEVTAGGAFQVSLQSGSGYANSVTIPKASALAGITVYVRYTAGSSATTGTLTLTSTGATPKTVDLTGAVSTLTVSPSSLSLSSSVGVQATGTFDVEGSALVDDVTLSIEGSILQEQTVDFQDDSHKGYIKRDTGSMTASNDWYTSDFYPIGEFVKTDLLAKHNSVANISLWSASKTYLGHKDATNTYGDVLTASDLASATFVVQGKDISDVAYIRLSNSYNSHNKIIVASATDASSDFSVSPASISEVDGDASGTVTVGFTPSAAGSYSGKVTVSSGSVSKEVTITGTAS